MRLRNRINVICSRFMNELIIVDDIENILKKRFREHRHLSNIFNYIKQRRHEYKCQASLPKDPDRQVPELFQESIDGAIMNETSLMPHTSYTS